MAISGNFTLYALSTSTYKDESINLPGVKNSMDRLRSILIKYCDRIFWHVDETNEDASKNISRFLNEYKQNGDDTLVLYFCGHGYLTADNSDLLLSTTDTMKNVDEAEIGIRCKWLLSKLNKCKIRRYIVVLDCCSSAIMSSMGNDRETEGEGLKIESIKGGAILTATDNPFNSAKELEIEGKPHAAFTFFFTEALKHQIDKSEKNQKSVTLKDIYDDLLATIKKSKYSENIPKPQMKCNSEVQEIPLFRYKTLLEKRKITKKVFSVLLVKSAIDFPIKDYDFGVPLGLWLLKSYFNLQGTKTNVQVYDERLELRTGKISNFEDVIKDYDMVGVSICSCEVPPAIRKLKIAKEKGKITFVGGIFCSSNEKYLLEYPWIDYVIPEVSTVPLYKLVQELSKERYTGGSSTVDYVTGAISKNNLDNLTVWKTAQLPDIELRTWKEIVNVYGRFLDQKIDVFTTRGCSQRCAFCSVQKECQQRTYQRNEKSVIAEIKFLYNAGFRRFSIKDEDFFLYGEHRLLSVIEECHKECDEITFKIRARVDEMRSLNIDLKMLYTYGVREIQYGLETPDEALLRKVKKGYRYGAKDLSELIRKTTECGIVANCSFILGIAGETKDYYESLMEFFRKLNVDRKYLKIYINFLTPHPYKNEFPAGDYKLITTDLKYFTHKVPVAIPDGMNRITRKKMLDTYDRIVAEYKMEHYNPKIDPTIRSKFIEGETVPAIMPHYERNAIHDY